MDTRRAIGLAVVGFLSCAVASTTHEPVVGLPCEGCEAVFEGRPEHPPSIARIAPEGEPGERLTIEGTVTDAAGKPAPGIVVYAYHTNAKGIYPPDEKAPGPWSRRHGLLRGWATTDAQGRYRFETIRPAAYPNTSNPHHVHLHVLEPGRCTYTIDELHFDDDPLLTAEERGRAPGRGGKGIVMVTGDAAHGWNVRRDIKLGERVPGYPS